MVLGIQEIDAERGLAAWVWNCSCGSTISSPVNEITAATFGAPLLTKEYANESDCEHDFDPNNGYMCSFCDKDGREDVFCATIDSMEER